MSKLFNDFVETTSSKELTVQNDKIQQVQRNELKESAIVGLLDLLTSQGVDAFRTVDGVVMAIDNEKTRKTIYVAIDPVIKQTDYDLDGAIQEYDDKVAAKLEREAKLAAKKAEKATKPRKTE